MKMEKLTFEDLPGAIAKLLERMERIEMLLEGEPAGGTVQEEMMNVRQAAEFLELSVPTIYSKVCRGELTAYKPGHKLYFDRRLLTEYIRSVKKQSNREISSMLEINLGRQTRPQKRKALRWNG